MATDMKEHVRPQQDPAQQMINQIAVHEARSALEAIVKEIKKAKEQVEKNLEALNPIARGMRLFKTDNTAEPLAAFERTLHSYQKQAIEVKDIENLVKNLAGILNNLSLSIDQEDDLLAPFLTLTNEAKIKLAEIRKTQFEAEKIVKSRLIPQQQDAKKLITELLEKYFNSPDAKERSLAKNISYLSSAMTNSDELNNLFSEEARPSPFDLFLQPYKYSNVDVFIGALADQFIKFNPRIFTLEDLHEEILRLDEKLAKFNKAILSYQHCITESHQPKSKPITWQMAITICSGLFEIEDYKACENIIKYLRTQKHLDSNFPCQIAFPEMDEMSFRTFNGMLDLIEDKLARNAVLNIHKKTLFMPIAKPAVLSVAAAPTSTLSTAATPLTI